MSQSNFIQQVLVQIVAAAAHNKSKNNLKQKTHEIETLHFTINQILTDVFLVCV